MCFETLNRKLKNGYKAFCEETSMHGFLELYRAKHCFWKIVWLILLVACFGITAFQLCNSVNQYINQTTVTSIQPATESDIIYPPLKYCFNHWLYWFQISEDLLKFMSKPTLLLALSRLSIISTDKPFDISKSESDLIKIFKEKQNTTFGITSNYNDFFIKNSKDLSTVLPLPSPIFDKQLVFIDENVYMCYTLNETVVQSMLNEQRPTLAFSLSFSFLNSYDIKLLAESTFFLKDELLFYFRWSCMVAEYNGLCKNYVEKSERNNNLYDLWSTIFNYSSPNVLIVDGSNKQPILLSRPFRTYTVQLQLAVEKWLPDGQKKCNPNVRSLFSKETCAEKCKLFSYTFKDDQNVSTSCKKVDTLILLQEETSMENVCRNDIRFQSDIEFSDWPLMEEQGSSQEIVFEQCMDSCFNGCEKRKWEQSVFASKFTEDDDFDNYFMTIIIQYPAAENILILKELDSKTWEDFVSNVGGLLGIWTGASILSLLQLIYLFCCAPDDTTSDVITVVPKFKVRNNYKKKTKITVK